MAHAEASARTVDAAVTAAAAQLDLRPDQVDVEILEEPVPSTFGHIGTPARVRVTPSAQATLPPSPDTAASVAMGEGRAATTAQAQATANVAAAQSTDAGLATVPSGSEEPDDTSRANDSYGSTPSTTSPRRSPPSPPLQVAEAHSTQEPSGEPSEPGRQQPSAPGASDTGTAGEPRATAALGAENGPTSASVAERADEQQPPAAESGVGGGNHRPGPEEATGLSVSTASATETIPSASAASESSSATRSRRAYRDEAVEPEMVEADTERAGDFLEGLLDAIDVDGDITTWVDESGGHIDLEGSDLDVLVGSNGETLDALQELTRIAVLRQSKRRVRLLLDINGYRARHRDQLIAVVKATAERVIASREDHEFEPMTPAERKIVHDAVAAIDGVQTESLGEEPYRRVIIRPA
ncbi:MAG TPA: RNA-binding cell elongation regulator Jag/EloR [Actinomycetes bacterium]|nr:RNA-binding cell elongation regulator Jag/EloR [Actinomycetes bacterium]